MNRVPDAGRSPMPRWWSKRSDPERFDLFTRWSLYLLVAMAPLIVACGVADLGAPTAVETGTVLLVAGQGLAACLALRTGIDQLVAEVRPDRPRRQLVRWPFVAVAILTVVGVATVLLVPEYSYGVPDNGAAFLLIMVAAIGICPLTPLLTTRSLLLVCLTAIVLTTAIAVAQGLPPGQAAITGAATLLGLAGIMIAFRGSVWMLLVVWRIEVARGIEAKLAVAEERLRFARDLHDVLGRNLSAMAVKSELAAELARRGRDEAVTEMGDVQRLAHESLREVRAVVRGYRRADLTAELSGARSVLGAAGIECRVSGDPAAVPLDVQEALGWVVREATTNVLRHSRATHCTITVSVDDRAAELTITDDGPTPEAQGPPRTGAGTGLAGLTERLASLNGSLESGPVAPQGFRVTARIPLVALVRPTERPAGRPAGAAR